MDRFASMHILYRIPLCLVEKRREQRGNRQFGSEYDRRARTRDSNTARGRCFPRLLPFNPEAPAVGIGGTIGVIRIPGAEGIAEPRLSRLSGLFVCLVRRIGRLIRRTKRTR